MLERGRPRRAARALVHVHQHVDHDAAADHDDHDDTMPVLLTRDPFEPLR